MSKVTKQDIIDAFQQNKRKRSLLLYEYYYQDYFSGNYTASYIAEKITADLGLPITANMIRIAKHRVGKTAHSSHPHQQLTQQITEQVLQSLQTAPPSTVADALKQQLQESDQSVTKIFHNMSYQQLEALASEQFSNLIESPQLSMEDLQYLDSILQDPSRKLLVYAQIKTRKQKTESITKPRKRLFE